MGKVFLLKTMKGFCTVYSDELATCPGRNLPLPHDSWVRLQHTTRTVSAGEGRYTLQMDECIGSDMTQMH